MSNIEELVEVTEEKQLEENNELLESDDNKDSDEYVAQFSDIEYELEQVEPVKVKKKFPLQASIVVALFLVIGAVIAYFALSLFIPTVEGCWLYEQDGMKSYYIIESEGDKYSLKVRSGSTYVPGECVISNTEGNDILAMNLASGQMMSSNYKVEGNRLFGERTLTLFNEEGLNIVLKAADEPELSDLLKPYENFKTSEKILGEWELDYGMGQKAHLTFDEDGVMTLDEFGTKVTEGMYTVDGKNIKTKLYIDKEYEEALPYEVTDKGLVFLNVLWSRPNTASADQK